MVLWIVRLTAPSRGSGSGANPASSTAVTRFVDPRSAANAPSGAGATRSSTAIGTSSSHPTCSRWASSPAWWPCASGSGCVATAGELPRACHSVQPPMADNVTADSSSGQNRPDLT